MEEKEEGRRRRRGGEEKEGGRGRGGDREGKEKGGKGNRRRRRGEQEERREEKEEGREREGGGEGKKRRRGEQKEKGEGKRRQNRKAKSLFSGILRRFIWKPLISHSPASQVPSCCFQPYCPEPVSLVHAEQATSAPGFLGTAAEGPALAPAASGEPHAQAIVPHLASPVRMCA